MVNNPFINEIKLKWVYAVNLNGFIGFAILESLYIITVFEFPKQVSGFFKFTAVKYYSSRAGKGINHKSVDSLFLRKFFYFFINKLR